MRVVTASRAKKTATATNSEEGFTEKVGSEEGAMANATTDEGLPSKTNDAEDINSTVRTIAAAALVAAPVGADATVEEDKSEVKSPALVAGNDKGTEKEAEEDTATVTKGTAKQRVENETRKDDVVAKGSAEEHCNEEEAVAPDSQEGGKKVENAENEGGKEAKTSGQKSAVAKAKESTPNSAETPKFTSTGGRFKRTVAHKSAPKPPAAAKFSESGSNKRKAPQKRGTKSEPARKRMTSAESGNHGPHNPIWTGAPDEDMSKEGGWPKGWKKEIHVRKSGATMSRKDRYWFSPKNNLKFRSLTSVKAFMKKLKECDGDEQKAYKMADVK